jgi:hypothetical protein
MPEAPVTPASRRTAGDGPSASLSASTWHGDAWAAVATSHAAGFGYWRESSDSGVRRIFDVWPYIGLIALPITILWLVRRDVFARGVSQQVLALQFLILVLHQSEEYLVPGKFVPWWNRVVVRSGRNWFPMTKALAFGINVPFGWGLTLLAIAAGDHAAWLFATVLGTHVINVSAHTAYAIGESRYNPGLFTALVLLLPSAAVGFHTWINAGRMTLTEAILGLVLAACAAAAGSREYQRRLGRLRCDSDPRAPTGT